MKKFTIKIYQSDGSTFLKAFDNSMIKNDISFISRANGGLGELVLDVNLPFDEKDSSIDFMNVVKVYMSNEDNPKGKLIYTGFISRFTPYFTAGNEGVRVTVLGLVSLLAYAYYKTAGGSFTVSHSSVDVKDILEDIIDRFQAVYSSVISYTPTSIATVGTNVSYDFVKKKWREAVDEAFGLTGGGYYWFLDQEGVFNLKLKPSTATHTFTIGKDIESFTINTDSEPIVNDVTLDYNGGSATSSDATSISNYGTREEYINDQNISDATTAGEKADFEVSEGKDTKIKAQLAINENYDLESIQAGDTCKVQNIKKGSNIFSSNMTISGVHYMTDRVLLTLEDYTNFGTTLFSNFAKNANS